jgi:hypothetical protein
MRRLKKKNLTVAAFIVIGGIVSAGSSYAATLTGTASAATGIDGLVVDGVTYNVKFDPGSYSSVYAATPTFLGDQPGAQAAAIALAAALQSLDVTGIAGISSSYNYQELDIPYQLEGGVVFVEQAVLFPPWTAPFEQGFLPSQDVTTADGNTGGEYALLAPTPIPAALTLFATGLGGLGLLGWRRKRKNTAIAA